MPSVALYCIFYMYLYISNFFLPQHEDRAIINEVRRFVFSGPLTQQGVALRDITYVRK